MGSSTDARLPWKQTEASTSSASNPRSLRLRDRRRERVSESRSLVSAGRPAVSPHPAHIPHGIRANAEWPCNTPLSSVEGRALAGAQDAASLMDYEINEPNEEIGRQLLSLRTKTALAGSSIGPSLQAGGNSTAES